MFGLGGLGVSTATSGVTGSGPGQRARRYPDVGSRRSRDESRFTPGSSVELSQESTGPQGCSPDRRKVNLFSNLAFDLTIGTQFRYPKPDNDPIRNL